jgi:zinc protease
MSIVRKMQKKINLLILSILVIPWVSAGQYDPSRVVSLDPEVRSGVLENGMTYYIRHNREPADRASFYIVHNVGALLEEDDQNGLAHFLEHMAFNGTLNFEGKGILNTLERHGVAFGRNINAYTSYDETVYNISDVPVNRPGLLDTCLLILHDWSNYLLLNDEDIDNERGVITEEWRTRRNSATRIQNQWFPVLFRDSQYAKRDVIGDTTVIRHHRPETLRKFYHDWYRTDLQAIIIVGDFDVDEMEEMVKYRFASIPPVENPQERPFFEIPFHHETYFVVATDPEATQSQVTMYILFRNNDLKQKTLANMREGYIRSLYNSMSGMRISELLQQGEPPFINGYSQISGFVRGYDAYIISAVANPHSQAAALESIMTETERILRHGFTESELERARANYLTSLESRYKQRDKISNDALARQLQSHYLVNSAVPGIEFEYEFAKTIIPGITAEEVSAMAQRWIRPDNRTIVITGPEAGKKHLTENEALALVSKVSQKEIEPYDDGLSDAVLISEELQGGAIIKTSPLVDFNAVEWTLENNLKVVYRHADYEKDNVSLLAYSPGGASLWDDQYVPSLGMINEFITSYGVGDFNAISLEKMLAGKRVSLRPFISERFEGFNGSSAPRDFETLMKLVWLYFEQPRFDDQAHDALMSRYRSYVRNLQNDPRKIMSDSLSLILSDYHPRVRLMDASYLDAVSIDHIQDIYLDRIHDAGDFTFFIVGNIDEEIVKPLVEKYLGSLSSTFRTETWKDHGIRVPPGTTSRRIEVPLATPKASVNISFVNNVAYNAHTSLAMSILQGVLNLRYIETVREEEGGTYGVSVRASISRNPVEEGRLSISFDTDPEKSDYLKSIIYREIDKILDNGPTPDDFDKTIQNLLKDREQSRNHNNFWMSSLYNFYTIGINFADTSNYEDILKRMTPDDIQAFAKQYFTGVNTIDVVFLPKSE